MARIIYELQQSLDGYVDHLALRPDAEVARHCLEDVRGLSGCVYGRGMYEVMTYWEEDQPDWDVGDHEFAALWRKQRKWVVSRSLKSVGSNATLVANDLGGLIRRLKAEEAGEIGIAGPKLAGSVTELGLVDEYRIFVYPVVLGGGSPMFTGPRPPLRLVGNQRIGENVVKLTYVPA